MYVGQNSFYKTLIGGRSQEHKEKDRMDYEETKKIFSLSEERSPT